MTTIDKALVALVGAVAEAIDLGLLPDSVKPYLVVVIGFLTALGVYAAPNKPAGA